MCQWGSRSDEQRGEEFPFFLGATGIILLLMQEIPDRMKGEKMIITTNLTRLIALAALIVVLLVGVIHAAEEGSGPAGVSLTDIKVSFKLDPRVTRGMYMGDRWISPPTYIAVQDAKELTVEARSEVLDAKGKLTDINPAWTPSDPEMVTVSPSQGNEVKITVKRTGESTLKLASPGVSKELFIKAMDKGNGIQVEISQ